MMVIDAWIQELREDTILDRLGVEPGDLHRAVDSADWLLYCLAELSRLFEKFELIKEAEFLRKRVQSGIKAELVPSHEAGRDREGQGALALLRRVHHPQVDEGGQRGEARPRSTRSGQRWRRRSRNKTVR